MTRASNAPSNNKKEEAPEPAVATDPRPSPISKEDNSSLTEDDASECDSDSSVTNKRSTPAGGGGAGELLGEDSPSRMRTRNKQAKDQPNTKRPKRGTETPDTAAAAAVTAATTAASATTAADSSPKTPSKADKRSAGSGSGSSTSTTTTAGAGKPAASSGKTETPTKAKKRPNIDVDADIDSVGDEKDKRKRCDVSAKIHISVYLMLINFFLVLRAPTKAQTLTVGPNLSLTTKRTPANHPMLGKSNKPNTREFV